MCGRFALTVPAKLKAIFPNYRFPKIVPRYNIAPTQPVIAIPNTGTDEAQMIAWGMGGNINARAETVTEKPTFKHAARAQRAIVFADGYYEWKVLPDGKQPFYVRRADGEPFTFAALHDAAACALITTAARGSLASIHHRMPVILTEASRERWLDERPLDDGTIAELLADVVCELESYPVSVAVNRVANDRPALIERVAPPEQPSLF
ncbi:MAG TPA: SOS response-associated peptidase [Candidatus Aquilonibacter sp.]|nr:SOS response-associated peptidase [Candidatus Aquilonibacter sp.]